MIGRQFFWLWLVGAVLLAPLNFGKTDFASALAMGVGAGIACAVLCSPLLFFGGSRQQRMSRGLLAVVLLCIALWALRLIR